MALTKRQYLAAMGIDVWVPRVSGAVDIGVQEEASSATPLPDAAAPKSFSQKKAERPAPRRKVAAPPPAPAFSLALLHYGSVGLCLSLEAGGKLPRRFCDDVARAGRGDVENARFQQLDWPMLKSTSIDQSIDVAREVVARKFLWLPDRIFVFGEDVCDYHQAIAAAKPGQVVRAEPKHYTLMGGVFEVMASADAKRLLWKLISQ